jgi:serine phosphatase RsbU (regulator of sigma subunit)
MIKDSQLQLRRPTIARDLTLGLIAVLTFVFFLTAFGNWYFTTQRDGQALEEKANEIMDNLTSVLVTPMWNINTIELKKIVDIYRRHSEIIIDIKVMDEAGELLIPTPSQNRSSFMDKTRIVYHEKTPLGRVSVSFSNDAIVAKQKEFAIYSVLIFAILVLALTISNSVLLKLFLTQPFRALKEGLDIISDGNYTHSLSPARQDDVNGITEKVNAMALQIANRESALEENRGKLEILNQAILDIFSCSNTDSLIRTAMFITHKVCNVDYGWFLGTTESKTNSDEEPESIPVPLVCIRGNTFEATEKEVALHIGSDDGDKIFTFLIKSRHREVGQMTLAFDEAPDKSVIALIKSIMSLVTLAQTRQSFIRETAFISAELQVAETVQKSLLPDDNSLPKNASIAYYYEPVLRVGGDWFSIIESTDKRYVYIILGDVTGHGLAQGLITTAMAGAINIVESTIHSMDVNLMPSDIVNQLSNVINKVAGKSNLRMTLVAARIDLVENRVHVTNAGHTFPLVLKNIEDNKIKVKSLAEKQQHMLGEDSDLVANRKYTDAEYSMDDDDLFVFYTDGLTEAVNKDGQAFNRKFIRQFNKSEGGRTVKQILDSVMHTFTNHTGDIAVNDDICVVIVGKRTANVKSSSGAA